MSAKSVTEDKMTKRQRTDFEWFKFMMPELYKKYGHCYAAISDREVLGTFPSYSQAVDRAIEQVGYGNFIVQEVGDSADAYTATFTSMWVIA